MAVQLSIPYETLLELVEQLPEQQQKDLLQRLIKRASEQTLTTDEKLALFHSMTLDLGGVQTGYSDHREDWYGDDGQGSV